MEIEVKRERSFFVIGDCDKKADFYIIAYYHIRKNQIYNSEGFIAHEDVTNNFDTKMFYLTKEDLDFIRRPDPDDF